MNSSFSVDLKGRGMEERVKVSVVRLSRESPPSPPPSFSLSLQLRRRDVQQEPDAQVVQQVVGEAHG